MTSYPWDARDYEKYSSQQQVWAQELIRKLSLRGDEALLDIGCGDGKVTIEIASHLPRGYVIGVDRSNEMISLAQKRYSAQNFQNVHFQYADASHLPFHDQFDLVFSNATLHWLLDHRPVLQGIARSLKHGGKTLLQMGGKGNASDIISIIEDRIVSNRWGRYFRKFDFPYGFYSPDEYIPWMNEAGLHPLRVELIPKDMTHQGRDQFAGWIRTTWLPYTLQVPESEREYFIDEIVEAYLFLYPVDDRGAVHVRMIRLEVEAVTN